MNTPLISIIMPAHDAAGFIGKAVASVLSQDYENWELIIVDDCSHDCTAETALEAVPPALSEKVKILRNEKNLGAAGSRNRGVSEARGEWIAFLDSDDAWEKSKLSRQVSLIEGTDAVIIFTGSAFMDENGMLLSHRLHVPERVSYEELLSQNVISCSSVLVRRDIYLSYPMPECKGLHEDFASWLMILKNTGLPAAGIDEPLLIYRVSSSSQSGNKLKAARMNFKVYRHIGLSFPKSIKYEFLYAVNGLRKWKKIMGSR